MTLPPLVERELRAGARQQGFFWLRGLLALAAGFQAYELLDRYGSPLLVQTARAASVGAPAITGADLLRDMSWLAFAAALVMGLLTADAISREWREGTLGLLLLTDLSPAQIVYSKMLSCGLTACAGLLGILPPFMITILVGGVSGLEALLTGLGLLNTLFVSLAVGLWMSTVFRQRHFAVLATLAVVGVLAFGAELIGGPIVGTEAGPLLRFFGIGGWMTVPRLPVLLPVRWLGEWTSSGRVALLLIPLFLFWFAAMHALGWLILRQAASTLARHWQDQAHRQHRAIKSSQEYPQSATAAGDEAEPALSRESWLTVPRPWDADPIRWRVERMGTAEGLISVAVVFGFFAQFGVLGSMFGSSAGSASSWGLLSFVGVIVVLASSGLLAWAGARFFQQSRRQQDLELLLTTPIGGRTILTSQWRALRRSLARPVGVVLGLALPAGLVLIHDLIYGNSERVWFLLHPFLIAVNLAIETVTLCGVGMWFGLRARNGLMAVALTIAVVQLLPLALVTMLIQSFSWLAPHSAFATLIANEMPVIPILVFLIAKNVVLIAWARFRLRRELRLGLRRAHLDAAARRVTLQPA